MQPHSPYHPITLNTAAVLTGRSTRTWQRRIEEGLVPRLGDRRGALVPFEAVRPALAVCLTEDDVQMLVRADQGNAAAQAGVGALFALAAMSDAKAAESATVFKAGRGLEMQAATALSGKAAPSGSRGGNIVAAMHFLTQAAEQGEADAMHWLGMLHAAGLGGGDGHALALMWIAKSAAHGHVVAQRQLAALMPGLRPRN